MTFSPEDNLGSVPPPEGSTSFKENEPTVVEPTLDDLGDTYRVTSQEVAGEVAFGDREELQGELDRLKNLRKGFQEEQEMIKGELAIAMAKGDIDTVKDTYLRLIESKVKGQENEVEILDVDFAGGDFQSRMSNPEGLSGQELIDKVRGVYESQLNIAQSALDDLNKLKQKVLDITMPNDLIEAVKREDDSMVYGESMVDSLQKIFNEVDQVNEWDKQSPGSYGNYTKKLEGALRSATEVQRLVPDPRLRAQLDSAARRYKGLLPEDLTKEIETI